MNFKSAMEVIYNKETTENLFTLPRTINIDQQNYDHVFLVIKFPSGSNDQHQITFNAHSDYRNYYMSGRDSTADALVNDSTGDIDLENYANAHPSICVFHVSGNRSFVSIW